MQSQVIVFRILPVKINDLDPEDNRLLENELGGVLRAVDFIYKEPGVNRPLTPDDDDRKNLNKTKYRNQINKVANAVKEIIKGLKYPGGKTQTEKPKIAETKTIRQKIPWMKISVPALILTIIFIVGYFILPPVIKKSSGSSSSNGKSIAVLPFDNLSNDPDQEYLSACMVDEILDKLCKIGGLKVISRTSSERFKNVSLPLKDIASELGVATILVGSAGKIGDNVRITAQLIDPSTDVQVWSEIYNKDISDIFKIQSDVARNVARKLKAVISNESKQRIDNKPTTNMAAYEAYWRGMLYHRKLNREDLEIAMKYFELQRERSWIYTCICRYWQGVARASADECCQRV